MKGPLFEFTLEELVQEIKNRYDVVFLAVVHKLGEDRWMTMDKGSQLAMRGLLASVIAKIDQSVQARELGEGDDWLESGSERGA